MIQFVDTDAEKLTNEVIAAFQQATGQILYPGDPRRIFLLQFVPLLLAAKSDINYTANQNLLKYAQGEVLDELGRRVGVTRLPASPAKVTMRFVLSTIRPTAVTIPAGTRVTPDGTSFFATVEELTIPPGALTGDVDAESQEGGERYNGFVPGQINVIVDPIPYVSSVSNIDESTGGADEESDDAFRERQRLAPSSFSTAGPQEAYIYHALSANAEIVDVAVTSPSPKVVNIYVLMRGGELPTEEVLDQVAEKVNNRKVRPLTDYVTVHEPTTREYDIDLTYYVSVERQAEEESIRKAIEGTDGVIDQYVLWQRSKLGRNISPDNLLSRLYAAGASRVELVSPTYAEVSPHVVSLLGVRSVTYGGLI